MSLQNERLLGTHMSISGGISQSIDRGLSIGCKAIQIFTGYNNRWISKPISSEDLYRFFQKKSELKVIFAHNNYLINLASDDPVNGKKSFSSMLEEIGRAEQLKLPFLVMHPGSHLGMGENKGLKRVAEKINLLIEETKDFTVKVLLENTAGQGTNLGYKFEHLAEIFDKIKDKSRIGICFDTCHAFAAGYDIRSYSGYGKTFEIIDNLLGISNIYAFHLNDSKYQLASKRDRHEHIGKGFLGLEAFRLLLNDERFRNMPMVLETPKGEGMGEDRRNLDIIKGLIQS